jgi:hypothetical protein
MELLPKRRLECVIHLMKGNHLNLIPHLFVVFPFSLECTLWNHCFHSTLLSFYPFPSLCPYNVIFCYISLCICFVVSLVLLFNVYCSYTRWFRVWSQRYHFEYLTFYCAIEKGEFKDLHQLKKDMFNFIVVSNICFVVHIVSYYNEER